MWESIYSKLPANNEVVWVRVLSIYGQLALAKYSVAQAQFTVQGTGVKIPVYFVARWRQR